MAVDLRIGNLDLFIEIFNEALNNEVISTFILSGMPYNRGEPLPSVVEAIKKLHKKYHPGLITEKTKIVVGSGASQLISSFFYLHKSSEVLAPYWFRVPTLSQMHDSKAIPQKKNFSSDHTKLIAYPNNPDGQLVLSKDQNTWYDCVYLWPWYFNSQAEYDESMENLIKTSKTATVFGLSKMTGHCGVRFGWALIEDENLVKKIETYVDYESGGLSFDVQTKTAAIFERLLDNNRWLTALEKAKNILAVRKEELQVFCHKKGWSYETNPGIFAWITTDEENAAETFEKLGILGTAGSKCGGKDNQIRLNLALNNETWEKMLNIIS